jgi:hypothetical protein
MSPNWKTAYSLILSSSGREIELEEDWQSICVEEAVLRI